MNKTDPAVRFYEFEQRFIDRETTRISVRSGGIGAPVLFIVAWFS